ncbi:dNA repair protein RecN [Ruminococcus sp. CAG:403]|nr:dNA repair protein RecN [Ruminococcus sp. CAG:403]
MLTELFIENLAVIQQARISFSTGLHVFTGETGAGKSIFIHGINAVLGQRVSRDLVRTGCERAIISALFTHLPPAVVELLKQYQLEDGSDELLLTREILADGGSIARINQRTATASMLRELGVHLIHIHGQHDNQILMTPERHMDMIDAFGGNSAVLTAYQTSFRALQQKAKRYSQLRKSEQEKQERAKYLQSLVEEVEQLQLKPGEEATMEEEFNLLQHTEQIASALQAVQSALDQESDIGAVDLIQQASSELLPYTEFNPIFQQLQERLEAASIELRDIAAECSNVRSSMEFDALRYQELQTRMQALYRLNRMYQCTGDELLHRYQEAKKELQSMQSDQAELQTLQKEKEQLLEEVSKRAKELSQYRIQTAAQFVAAVTEQLEFLNMPNVVLDVAHQTGKLTIHGMDTMELLISANKGETPKPLAKIASGGELSRIMLALQCVTADQDAIPTMIFDEIDTGVSGKAAQKIGMKLREVSKNHQVLCVTHLAQIAVMGEHHFMIEKKVQDGRTQTFVQPLDAAGRIAEIARIMGGESPSSLLLKTAQEELQKWRNLS